MFQTSSGKLAHAVAAAGKPKTCFVVSPIGPDGSQVRKQSDQVLKHIIKKALEPRYLVERGDEINRSGTIIGQIVERVLGADLVVADLSGLNANVFYELAIRHAAHKPAVHLAATAQVDIPFDVSQLRLIKFDLADPDSIEDAQKRLNEQVRAIEAGEQSTTPVHLAQIMHSLESGDTRDQQLFELLRALAQGIQSVQGQIANLGAALPGNWAFGTQGFAGIAKPATPYLTVFGNPQPGNIYFGNLTPGITYAEPELPTVAPGKAEPDSHQAQPGPRDALGPLGDSKEKK